MKVGNSDQLFLWISPFLYLKNNNINKNEDDQGNNNNNTNIIHKAIVYSDTTATRLKLNKQEYKPAEICNPSQQ